MANDTTETRAPHVTSRRAERAGRNYLLWCLLPLFVGYIFPFVAERVAPLNSLSIGYYGHILDHGYNLGGDNADIVIFGDSSAIYGVDTARLSGQLGLKVTSIPGTAGSLPITGDRPLRHYLAGNRPPRLIVFYLSPWDLDFNRQLDIHAYEGDEQVLRHEPLPEILRVLYRHPSEMAVFPFRFYEVSSPLTALKLRPYTIPVYRGYVPYRNQKRMALPCTMSYWALHPPGTQSVQQLVRDFSSAQTKTLVYLAPLPDCLHAGQVAAFPRPGIDAQPPAVLPAADFSGDGALMHVLGPHSAETTDVLGVAIRNRLSR